MQDPMRVGHGARVGPLGKRRAMGEVLYHFSVSATNTCCGRLERTVLQQQTFHVFWLCLHLSTAAILKHSRLC